MTSMSKILAAAAMLASSVTAQALTVTLDASEVTVVRPVSGVAAAQFYATVTCEANEMNPFVSGWTIAYLADLSASLGPMFHRDPLACGQRSMALSFDIPSTQALGLYDRGYNFLTDQFDMLPQFNVAAELMDDNPNFSAYANTKVNYAVRVVDAPEPATLGLLALGIAGLGAVRRRRV